MRIVIGYPDGRQEERDMTEEEEAQVRSDQAAAKARERAEDATATQRQRDLAAIKAAGANNAAFAALARVLGAT